jgi:phage terminase large subunit GpA-like protein
MGDSNVGRGGGRSIFTAAQAKGAGIQRLDLNTDALKDEMMSMLRIGTADGLPPCESLPGYIHWPSSFSSTWFQQLTAEEKIAKGGKMRWVKHGQNHAADLFVYALGALYKVFADRAETAKADGFEGLYTWSIFWDYQEKALTERRRRGWV